METEVKNGRISYYGISSNTFVETEDRKDFTSLERIYNIAAEISNDNHFAVIQFPLNLIERGAVTNKNQLGNSKSLLEFAREKNLGVLINRPLNSIMNNKINYIFFGIGIFKESCTINFEIKKIFFNFIENVPF